jgi:hypothetical protein
MHAEPIRGKGFASSKEIKIQNRSQRAKTAIAFLNSSSEHHNLRSSSITDGLLYNRKITYFDEDTLSYY